jgi:hypothetical protein
LIAGALGNLAVSLIKAKGKLMFTLIFMIAGFTLIALPFWFTFKTVRASVCFF